MTKFTYFLEKEEKNEDDDSDERVDIPRYQQLPRVPK